MNSFVVDKGYVIDYRLFKIVIAIQCLRFGLMIVTYCSYCNNVGTKGLRVIGRARMLMWDVTLPLCKYLTQSCSRLSCLASRYYFSNQLEFPGAVPASAPHPTWRLTNASRKLRHILIKGSSPGAQVLIEGYSVWTDARFINYEYQLWLQTWRLSNINKNTLMGRIEEKQNGQSCRGISNWRTKPFNWTQLLHLATITIPGLSWLSQ